MSTETTTTFTVTEFFTADTYTPYQMASVVKNILEAVGLPTIPPQMIYGYVRQGYIAAEHVTVEIKKSKSERTSRPGYVVTKANAVAWTEKYVAKKLAPSTKK
jgi:hypothetical protein